MKIKVQPEDFIVEEKTEIKPSPAGDYNLYLLEKRYWNTIDAIKYLARRNKIPFSKFSYGGKKDRYALTRQHITISGRTLDTVTGMENLKLIYLGKTKEPFGPGHIKCNHFKIKIRDLSKEEADRALQNFKHLTIHGLPNYFGEQRFGSYDENLGFFAEKFLKAQYNGAIKCVLCSIFSEDKNEDKMRKALFFEHWGDFGYCLEKAKTALEKRIFSILKDKPKKFLEAIHAIPVELVSIYFSAYQSYLWNKMLDRLLSNTIKSPLATITIKNWHFHTFKTLSEGEFYALKDIKIPTQGLTPYFCNDEVEKLYDTLLREEGLHQGRFNFRHYRKVIIKSFQREALVFPGNAAAEPDRDEIYKGKYCIILSFELPKGAFATTLIKHLFI